MFNILSQAKPMPVVADGFSRHFGGNFEEKGTIGRCSP